MDITPVLPEGALLIEGYSEQGYRIAGTMHAGGVLICDTIVKPLMARSPDELTVAMFEPLLAHEVPPTLVLLGTGATQQFASPTLKAALRALGLTVESMTSPAACRTYNVLLAEGRRVAAALLPL